MNWNGGFAYLDPDEFAYAGYLQALIDGHSRLIDPYTGRQASELFSIIYSGLRPCNSGSDFGAVGINDVCTRRPTDHDLVCIF